MQRRAKRYASMMVGLCAVALTTADLARAAPTVLEPSGSWTLDYADEKCRLVRIFGTGDDQTLLYFEQFAPSNEATMTVAGRSLSPLARAGTIDVRFAPRDEEAWQVEVAKAEMEGFGAALILPFRSRAFRTALLEARGDLQEAQRIAHAQIEGMPQIEPSDVANIETLSLSRRNQEVIFPLPQFAPAMAALNDCALDLLRHWQLDPEQHATMTRHAEPINLDEIARGLQRSYPAKAVRAWEEGDLNLRIIVNADGSIAECAVNDETITHHIGTTACDEFGSRAMFAPAEDANGEPMKSFYSTRISYRLN
jgi:hypothetical protein